MATSELQSAFNEISQIRGLPKEIILEALQSALVSAYRRDTGASAAQEIEAYIDPKTQQASILVEKEVVEDVFSPETEILLEEAREIDPECQVGDVVMATVENTTKNFGRIAAQTAKQVILQKIREAERQSLYEEFIEREGDLITGTVQSMNPSIVTLSLGRAEAILPRAHQIPGERYRQHEKLRVYILEVKETNRGPQIVVSRAHRNMLRRLLEYEVPEIYNGQVEIKSIAREAGYRSKVAVVALQDGIDPVGACVGMRGIRIQNIVKELHDEKIDVIEWNPDPRDFIAKALSPARVTGVYLDDDIYAGRTAVVLVPDEQLSLAIGREGQNARLAAKLTGWRIDIKSVSETIAGALENLDVPPFSSLMETHGALVEDVRRIVEKRNNNLVVIPEEFNTLNNFADLVETRLLQEREELRKAKLEEIKAVKATLPQHLFDIPVDKMGFSDDMATALEEFGNAGEIMLLCLINEEQIRRTLVDISGNPMGMIQSRLDELVINENETVELVEEIEEEEAEEELEAIVEEIVDEAEEIDSETEVVEEIEEVIPEMEVLEEEELSASDKKSKERFEPSFEVEPELEYEDDYMSESRDKKKKSKQKRRQLVYDEETGQTFAKRRRKGSRKRDEWEDY